MLFSEGFSRLLFWSLFNKWLKPGYFFENISASVTIFSFGAVQLKQPLSLSPALSNSPLPSLPKPSHPIQSHLPHTISPHPISSAAYHLTPSNLICRIPSHHIQSHLTYTISYRTIPSPHHCMADAFRICRGVTNKFPVINIVL